MMKLVLFALLASLTVTVRSGGFSYSSGWSPGQTVTAQRSTPTGSSNTQPASGGSRFSLSSLLTSGPIGGFFARSGVNITQKLEEAQRRVAELPWDSRIPMIRDDNFEDLIINESFDTREEEESRLWFLVVTTTSSQKTGISALVDEHFNEAYNITVIEQDLPNVRWGRIDYLNVTRLTTKWSVWRAPLFIVAKDNGKTLRFFYPQQMGVRAPQLRDFLLHERWQLRKPWSGPWAPGGSREELLDKFAVFQEKLYFYLVKIPRWVYLIISGGIGSVLIQIFHRKPSPNSGGKPQKVQPVAPSSVAERQNASVARTAAPSAESKKSGSQKRKGAKK